jgi:ABC-type transport system substrate-binding protein
MGANSYWERIALGRLNRRRALSGGATLGAGAAALLAGCGSGGKEEKKAGPTTEGRVLLPRDTSAQAKKGGIFQNQIEGDELNLDPLSTGRGNGGWTSELSYSRPFIEKAGAGGTKTAEFIGDLAESYEVFDGGLRLVVKLRPDAKWDARPPTNSRPVDTDDVLFSWDRYVKLSPFAAKLSYDASKGAAPIESVEKIDSRTYVYKSAYPWSPLIPSLTRDMGWIIPREAGDKFDPRNTVRGSGPFQLDRYEPSVTFDYRRNPNWHGKTFIGKDVPYLDGVDYAVLPEYSSFLSQFRSAHIWAGTRVKAEDALAIVNDSPNIDMYRGLRTNSTPAVIFMTEGGSPFLDVRVRRAVSMAIDRPLLAEVDTGANNYAKQGVPLDIAINSYIAAGWGGYYLNPMAKEMGEGGKYFEHNVAEAKKLLSAAGRDTMSFRIAFTPRYIEEKYVSAIADMFGEAGMKATLNVIDYQTVMIAPVNGILYSKGQFGKYGEMSFSSGGEGADPASTLFRIWHTDGSSSRANLKDPEGLDIDATIDKAMREFDANKYEAYVHDAQRKLAVHQPALSYWYSVSPLQPMQPWVMNWNAIRGSLNTTGLTHVWYDETKKKA